MGGGCAAAGRAAALVRLRRCHAAAARAAVAAPRWPSAHSAAARASPPRPRRPAAEVRVHLRIEGVCSRLELWRVRGQLDQGVLLLLLLTMLRMPGLADVALAVASCRSM